MGLFFRHLAHQLQVEKVSVEGLEPSTNGLKGHCSAIELHAPKMLLPPNRTLLYPNFYFL